MAAYKDFTLYRGAAAILRITMTTNGSVAGWTTKFTLRVREREADPPALLTVTSAPPSAVSWNAPWHGVPERPLSSSPLMCSMSK